jgi:RimJ/RimL family protein N-acetyltransferase
MSPTTVNWQPANLQDNLVRLQPLAEQDFDQLFQLASDPLIWQQHPSSNRYQEPVFREFFAGALASKAAFLIIEQASGQVIGCTRFYDHKENESIAIGFTFLARPYWGGRYNAAVKTLMLNYAFNHVPTVIFHIGSTNLRSQIATARFGAVKTGEFFTQDANGQRLSFEYSLHKHAWQQSEMH